MIYILEDDNSIRELVTYALNRSGYEAKGFDLPSLFWAEMEKQMPDLLLLDIMLPEEDGIHILKRLRTNSATSQLPVIMLTAKGSEYDRVTGLDAGADDYLVKPFAFEELLARLRVLLRKPVTEKSSILNVADLSLHVDTRRVFRGGQGSSSFPPRSIPCFIT